MVKMPAIVDRLLGRLSQRHRAGLFGIGWTGLAQVVGLVIKLGSTLVLTRLLAPDAYGILGTAMAVLTTLEWLSDLGILPALVRHEKGGEHRYLLTGWTMGFGRGAMLSISAAVAAWPLAAFYQEEQLFGVLLVLAARPFLFAIRSPGFPLLQRELNYKYLFYDEVIQTFVGTAASIAMAFVFRSVWAIVLGTMAGAIASVLLSYVLVPLKPRLTWDREAASDVYLLGKQVFINTLIMAVWLNLDRLLGLRFLTPTEMGIYAIAFNLSSVLEGLTSRICGVYFSVLAREEGAEKQRDWHQRVCKRTSDSAMPLASLLLLVAPWVIWILYDSRYHAAGLIFSILLARLMVRVFGQLQFQYLLARAEVRLASIAYVIAVVVQAAIFFPLVNGYGVAGMTLAVLISTIVVTLTQTLLLYRKMGDQLRPFFGTLVWAMLGISSAIIVYGNPMQVRPEVPSNVAMTVDADHNTTLEKESSSR